jgi:hypothetical protein
MTRQPLIVREVQLPDIRFYLNGEVVENPKDLTVTAADCLYFEVTGQQPEALYASFGGSITVVTPGCLYPLVHGSCLVFSPTARLKSWRVTAV